MRYPSRTEAAASRGRRVGWARAGLLAAALSVFPPAQARAEYPKHLDKYVNDFAHALNREDALDIRTLFRDLEARTGIQATAVVINSMAEYGTGDVSVEKFANSLFNRWGVGRRQANNGVMILVSIRDRKCRIELGSGYGFRYDAAMKGVIDGYMIPRFKANDYSGGTRAGAHAVVAAVTSSGGSAANPASGGGGFVGQTFPQEGFAARTSSRSEGYSDNQWRMIILLVLGIALLLFLAFSLFRSGQQGLGWAALAGAGALLVFLINILVSSRGSSSDSSDGGGGDSSGSSFGSSGDSSSGDSSSSSGGNDYGGGSSFGGGASGSW